MMMRLEAGSTLHLAMLSPSGQSGKLWLSVADHQSRTVSSGAARRTNSDVFEYQPMCAIIAQPQATPFCPHLCWFVTIIWCEQGC